MKTMRENNDEREIWNVGDLLSRSKNTSYRRSVIQRDTIVFKFLYENGLLKINPFDSECKVRPDLIVHAKDLTPEGLKMISWEDCAPEFKLPPVLEWHDYLDRGGNEKNINHLSKGLNLLKNQQKAGKI